MIGMNNPFVKTVAIPMDKQNAVAEIRLKANMVYSVKSVHFRIDISKVDQKRLAARGSTKTKTRTGTPYSWLINSKEDD